ncbi:SRPBCC domain-containing protein [Rhodobacteraceae bacterium NNCM2]|nr:SRPBCC domain-containing protein [Coraliihabitans acroporae]
MIDTMTKPSEVTLTREIKASIERVFALWTDRDAVISWFGMNGCVNHDAVIDARAGGLWHVAGKAPDGQDYRLEGTILEFEAPTRIVQSWQHVSADGTRGNMTRVEITFAPTEAGTLLTIHHRDILFTPEMFQRGWSDSIDKIEGILAA